MKQIHLLLLTIATSSIAVFQSCSEEPVKQETKKKVESARPEPSGPGIDTGSELGKILSGAQLFYGKPGEVCVAIQTGMDETGKSTRMTIYQDGNLAEVPYSVYTMELIKEAGDKKEFSVTLRDDTTGEKCDMAITANAEECQINWKPKQSEGCEAYRWGFDPGTTTFKRFTK